MLKEKSSEFSKNIRITKLNDIISEKRILQNSNQFSVCSLNPSQLTDHFIESEKKFYIIGETLDKARIDKDTPQIYASLKQLTILLNCSDDLAFVPMDQFFQAKLHLKILAIFNDIPEIKSENMFISYTTYIFITLACGSKKYIYETFGEKLQMIEFIEHCIRQSNFEVVNNSFYILANLSAEIKNEVAIVLKNRNSWKFIFTAMENFKTNDFFDRSSFWFIENIIESIESSQTNVLNWIFENIEKRLGSRNFSDWKLLSICAKILVKYTNDDKQYLGAQCISGKVDKIVGYRFDEIFSIYVFSNNFEILIEVIRLYRNISKSLLIHIQKWFSEKVLSQILHLLFNSRTEIKSMCCTIVSNLIISYDAIISYLYKSDFMQPLICNLEKGFDPRYITGLLQIFKSMIIKSKSDILIDLMINYQLFWILKVCLEKDSDHVKLLALECFQNLFSRGEVLENEEDNKIVAFFNHEGYDWKIFAVNVNDSVPSIIEKKEMILESYCPTFFK